MPKDQRYCRVASRSGIVRAIADPSSAFTRTSRHFVRKTVLPGVMAVLCILPSAARADLITNGGFSSGTLAGWSTFLTPNGTTGPGLPDVVSFNTTGSGPANSARFNVGEVNFDGSQQGGGLSQTINVLTGGVYSFSAAIASQDAGLMNGAAGLFSILINGTTEASIDLGAFASSSEILRGTLQGTVNLTPGSYTFSVEITRPFLGGSPTTPQEYVTDISLNPTTAVVPEPGTITLLATLLGSMGLLSITMRAWRNRAGFRRQG